MRRGSLSSILVGLAASACGGDATGPQASLCDVRNGAEVCATRAEYRPGQSVIFTIRNTSAAPIFKDGCSSKLVGVTSLELEFEEVYDPTLRCGTGATPADIVANMVEIAPGASFEESLSIVSFAFQGYYRVNVWILNPDGTLAATRPAFSGIFEVFPSAG